MGIKSCTKNLKGIYWNTFILFYSHTDNLCFYYKSLDFQNRTENLVNDLIKNSFESNTKLLIFKIKEKLNDIINKRKENLVNTKKLIKIEKKLELNMENSIKNNIKQNEKIAVFFLIFLF